MAGTRSFAQLVRHHRHGAGLTLEQLSERSGVSVRAISNMELGHSLGPQRKTLELLAGSLDLADKDRIDLLAAAEAGRRRVVAPAPTLLAMPRGVVDFVGRGEELAFLADLVDPGRTGPAAVVTVSGSPGVGKTSFAVHASRVLAASFPDGQLYLDLRGLDERPLEPSVALARLIDALAPGTRSMPFDEQERAGLLRTLLRDRRVIIVLDNAGDEAHVRVLLPGDGPSLMLVTSRRLLSGLETPQRLPLMPLARAHAVEMLVNLLGQPADADDDAMGLLAELGSRLPLALRLIGNRLAGHAGARSLRFLTRLSDEDRRLETLIAGDVQIGAVFASSYLQVSAPAQHLLRHLAIVPGKDIGPELAAVLAGQPLDSTELALDELVEYGLLEMPFSDRYRLHDLIRLYARARLSETEPATEIEFARRRAESWLLSTAVIAGRWFEPGFGTLPTEWDERVPLATAEAAQRWIEAEADGWLAALRTAHAGRRYAAVVDVAEAMHWFSDRWSHWGHWTDVFRLAASAAEGLGVLRAEATQLNYLSWALNVCDGDATAAIAAAEHAFAVARDAADKSQQGWARCYQAWAQHASGEADRVLVMAQEATALFEASGDREGLPQALIWVARAHELMGNSAAAVDVHQRCLALATDPMTAPGPAIAAATELSARVSIGRLQLAADHREDAIEILRPVVALAQEVAIPPLQARALAVLGEVLCLAGEPGDGREHLRAARELNRRLGNDVEAARLEALLVMHHGQ